MALLVSQSQSAGKLEVGSIKINPQADRSIKQGMMSKGTQDKILMVVYC